MPSETREENSAPGFKVNKDRFTLLFRANASGTFRCKPMMIDKSENPRALKRKNKDYLLVFWKSNPTAWVNQVIFLDWFTKSFVPDVKKFLTEKNLAFKIFLLLDNAKYNPETLQTSNPDVKVVFLPPNTISLIQPMDQTVIATFKAYYLRRVMRWILRHINRGDGNVEPRELLKSYWKNFSILDCISIIEES